MMRDALAAAATLFAAGCTLAEVTTEPSEDVIVVEAVLRTDMPRQQVLLHRALQGKVVGTVGGAIVTITGPDGRVHTLEPGTTCFRVDPAYAESDSIQVSGSCYATGVADVGWLTPGSTYDLRVETPDGRIIRGRTSVPGNFTVPSVRGGSLNSPRCSLAPNTTFTLVWTRSPGSASYVADLNISGLSSRGIPSPDPLELRGLAISDADTTIALPSEFGVFERFNYDSELFKAIEKGFPEGTEIAVPLAAADRNWVNSVRGGNFNPSGLIRISTVVGDGVGVFGALVVKRISIVVAAKSNLPRCGPAGG